ncbi:MAG: flagellar biosynthesis protein FlhF [Firmicutes bacterium HGW-Firmicutes-13]|nr:MAG: flagellar biosynthesis protein FlhF [Firmicutes bacterium HGW-Firmicutes-13]
MKIKKYTGADMREVMALIKKEMGSEAIILETRKVRQKGILGFFLPRLIEVTAAKEENFQQNFWAGHLETAHSKKIESDIKELKTMMENVMSRQDKSQDPHKGGVLEHIHRRLLDNEIDREIACQLIEEIGRDFPDNELTESQVNSLIQDKIGRRLKVIKFNGQRNIFCFVGPTGVGKTTTLAKLAAHFAIFKEKRVGLITIDTYRIGAVEQLKTYAQLMGLPIEVVMSPKELSRAIEDMKDLDIIMIDTAGRNSKNHMQIGEIKGFLKVVPGAVIFLVLSVTTKCKDLITIADNFKPADYNSLIFTKLDETDTFGSILNLTSYTSLPVSYLTIGQKVPEDLEIATEERLTSLILGVGK